MTITIPNAHRLLIEASLTPLQGTRFQPTGFPDVGAASYRLPDGTSMLLVESAQSVANRLEAVCWDDAKNELVPALHGLPYVRVNDKTGAYLTSSIQEAHRMNSVYIEQSDGWATFTAAVQQGKDAPVSRHKLAQALLKFDVGSLLHGVFLESIDGRLRLARAISGFVEARNVQVVHAGGVKNDRVRASKDAESGATAKDGFGNVPFHREEYVAEKIIAYFNIDLAQLRGYGFDPAVTDLLFALALWKIQAFLDHGLRLRTACDLATVDVVSTRPNGFAIPERETLEATLPRLITAARPWLGENPRREVTFTAKKATKAS